MVFFYLGKTKHLKIYINYCNSELLLGGKKQSGKSYIAYVLVYNLNFLPSVLLFLSYYN